MVVGESGPDLCRCSEPLGRTPRSGGAGWAVETASQVGPKLGVPGLVHAPGSATLPDMSIVGCCQASTDTNRWISSTTR
jgi:hypothetical protein